MNAQKEASKHYIVNTYNIKRSYKLGKVTVPAVKDLSIDLEKRRFISIVGPSGCGKTTTLNMIGTIDKPDKGRVEIDGKDIGSMSDNELTTFRGRNIGFIFQNFNLIPVLTVQENIAYPLQLQRERKAKIRERTNELIEAIGLGDWIYHRPNELSGGQRQRVAIARALVIEPLLVIADEPTANLDTKTSFLIMDLMKKLQEKLHTTFLFATHDPRFFDYMDTIYEMEDGNIKDIQHLQKR